MGLPELLRSLRQSAEQKLRDVEAEVERELDAIWRTAREELASQQQSRLEERRAVLETEKTAALAECVRGERLKTLEVRAVFLARLRAATVAALDAVKPDRYRAAARRLLEESLPYVRVEGATVWCAPSTAAVLEPIAVDFGLRVAVKEGLGAGFVLEQADGAARVDQRLRARLLSQWVRLQVDVISAVEERTS